MIEVEQATLEAIGAALLAVAITVGAIVPIIGLFNDRRGKR